MHIPEDGEAQVYIGSGAYLQLLDSRASSPLDRPIVVPGAENVGIQKNVGESGNRQLLDLRADPPHLESNAVPTAESVTPDLSSSYSTETWQLATAGNALAVGAPLSIKVMFGESGRQHFYGNIGPVAITGHENQLKASKMLSVPTLGLALLALKKDASALAKSHTRREDYFYSVAIGADVLSATGALMRLSPKTMPYALPLQFLGQTARSVMS